MSAAWLAHPEWAPAVLAGLLATGLALGAATLRARRRLRRLLGAGAPRGAGGARDALLLLALASIGAAALGPRIGERATLVTSSGVDVALLLDVSRSMDARDAAPSRMARARRAAQQVLARLEPGDRAALAAFAGRGVLLTPLTPDLDALADMLPAIDSDLMRARGSRLGDGVRAALGAFEPASLRPRVLLVLSDGEDPSPASVRDLGAAEAARAGVRVLAAAFGTTGGAPVPDGDVSLRDGEGREVRSRADPARLERLARATGGALLATDAAGALRLDEAVAALRRDAPRAPGEPVSRRVPAVQVLPFAGLAFLLLGLEAGLGRRRRGKRADAARPRGGSPSDTRLRPRAAAGGAAVLLGASLVGAGAAGPDATPSPDPARLEALEVAAGARPHDPLLLIRLGLARARAGRHEEASIAFLEAALQAGDPGLAGLAYYDLGVASLEAGKLERARDAFFDALAMAPGDRRTEFNLEWTLRALAARPPTPPRGGGAESRGGRGAESAREPEPARGGGDAERRSGEREPGEGGPGGAGEAGANAARRGEAAAPTGDALAEGAAAGQGPRSAGGLAAGALRGDIPELGADEVRRWLAAAGDDPARALREAARRAAPAAAAREPGEPTW